MNMNLLRLVLATCAIIGVSSFGLLALAEEPAAKKSLVVLTPEGAKIHAGTFVFDGHNDLPWEIRTKADGSFEKFDIAGPLPQLHTDLPRLKKGNVGAQFWSVYVPASTAQKGTAFQETLDQIALVKKMCEKYPEHLQLAYSISDIENARAAGKIASLMGVEGGHSIEDSIQKLRQLHEAGARYMTLTHSDTLSWADSATDTVKHEGLTPFGEEVIREMNKLGMLVDLSHVSEEAMLDALKVTQAPVIFSHSSARAIANHPRNVTDKVLVEVGKNRGVVMVNFFSGFIQPEAAKVMADSLGVMRAMREKYKDEKEYKEARVRYFAENPIPRGTIHDVVDHIDHIAKVAGIDCVGIGSDFDGVNSLPEQLEDVSTYPLITQELLNRGYTTEQIGKIQSGNVLRVMREAERVRETK